MSGLVLDRHRHCATAARQPRPAPHAVADAVYRYPPARPRRTARPPSTAGCARTASRGSVARSSRENARSDRSQHIGRAIATKWRSQAGACDGGRAAGGVPCKRELHAAGRPAARDGRRRRARAGRAAGRSARTRRSRRQEPAAGPRCAAASHSPRRTGWTRTARAVVRSRHTERRPRRGRPSAATAADAAARPATRSPAASRSPDGKRDARRTGDGPTTVLMRTPIGWAQRQRPGPVRPSASGRPRPDRRPAR